MSDKKLYVVGFGPGSLDQMTLQAKKTIENSDIIVGFTTYNKILRAFFPDKEYLDTGMGKEADRVKMALELALEGKKVSLVCSGDASIYGMAGLSYELGSQYDDVEIVIVPGVTAALSGSALLGAALGNDLCFISLSDYHTTKEDIIKRLSMAAACDFVIVLYNPRSKLRPEALSEACKVLLEVLPKDRICGVAESIGREGQSTRLLTLEELKDYEADMFSTAFIGNSKSMDLNGKMVTSRGYQIG